MKKTITMALLCLSLMSYGINLGSNFGITTISHAKKSGALFYQPSVLNISGTLVIDQEFSFMYSDMVMAPNAVIIVSSGKYLSFYDTHIYCPNGMWGGIVVYGNVTISESLIEDALVGTKVLPGGDCNIRRSIYNNCVIGTECEGTGFISVDRTNFLADKNGLHTPHPAIFNTSYVGINKFLTI